MMILITGGSGSGKSAYAEDCIAQLSEGCQKYYLATMQVYGLEGQQKVERHRKLRSGKGFITIEQPVSIERALANMDSRTDKCVLLECMSNLVANEMFSDSAPLHCELVVERVLNGVSDLKRGVKHLIIVTNNVFEDGITYDETTMEYIRALGKINEKLAAMSDRVIEVVVGIPLTIGRTVK